MLFLLNIFKHVIGTPLEIKFSIGILVIEGEKRKKTGTVWSDAERMKQGWTQRRTNISTLLRGLLQVVQFGPYVDYNKIN